jgi:hypothetical protein
LINSFIDGVVFDPGGPGETAIDHGSCTSEFCLYAVEIAADGSSFAPHLMENGTAGYRADRADGSFALASGGRWLDGRSPTYDLEWEAAIGVPDPGSGAGAWIHDAAALADGSIVVVGDYEGTITLGAGEPCETTLEPACDDCWYSAFLARYAW